MEKMKDLVAANAARADEAERLKEAAAAEAAAAEAECKEKAWREYQQNRRRKASRLFISRVMLAVVIAAGLWVAMAFDLIDPVLAIPLEALALCWVTAWTGAWLQYVGKGPLK